MAACILGSDALGVSCGTDEPDQKFWAVCGLAPRDRDYDEYWFPTGSGTLVRWTDSQQVEHLGIVTVRHFIHSGGSGGDCVLVGEIDEDDIECLSHITPMTIASPYELGLCRDQPVFMVGWGKTLDSNCNLVEAHSLHMAPTTITGVNCDLDGRGGAIMLAPGSCVANGACLPGYLEHDSGGAIAVEMEDKSLCLIGVLKGGGEFIASRHQFFSDPSATDHLCMPCRPTAPCGDINGSGSANSDDRTALEDLVTIAGGSFEVGCFCLGDLDGDGCAGTTADIALIPGGSFGQPCTNSLWCYGDTNLDGEVDASDAEFVADLILNEQTECPACTSCPPRQEWCPGDVDCSGSVTVDDLEIIQSLLLGGSYSCSATIPGCCRPSSVPEDPECTTCP